MDHLSRHRVGLALPLGLLGLLGAWMVGDYFGLDLLRAEGDARGGLVLLAPTLGATLGGLLSSRWVRAGWLRTAITAVVGTVALGAVIGGYATWLRQPSFDVAHAARYGVPTGVGTALAFLPFVWAVASFGRRVGRARAGSLVDESDVRGVWTLVAFGVALATPVVSGAGERAASFSVATTNALGAVATLVLFVVLGLDIVSMRRSRRAAMEIAGMREVSLDAVMVADVVDLGLGTDAFEELARGATAYRTNELPIRAILGSPQLATRALGAATTRSAILLTFALVAMFTAHMIELRV